MRTSKTNRKKEKYPPKETNTQIIKDIVQSEGIISAIGDGIRILDRAFMVLYDNQVHKDMMGDHLGEYCYKAYKKQENICSGSPVELAFKDGAIHTVQRELQTDEGIRYLEITASPLKDKTGKIVAGIEIVRDITKRKQADLSLALNATYGERMEKVGSLRKFRRDRQVGETLEYMTNLVKEGVDLFDVDLGCYENWWLPHPPNSLPSWVFLPVARLVKEFLAERGIVSNAGQPVPVVAVGKLGYPDLAEKALRDGMCDMIMLARPLLADPEWANKAYAGRVDEICPCIGDQEACLNEMLEGGHLKCSVNPRTGMEDVIARELTPAPNPPRSFRRAGRSTGTSRH